MIEEKKKKVQVDTSLVVHVDSIEADTTQLTQVDEPLGLSSRLPSIALSTISTSHHPLTKAMLYKMGNLVYSADVRALRVESTQISMINQVIHATLDPIQEDVRVQQESIMDHEMY